MKPNNWRAFVEGRNSAPYDDLKSGETIRGWIQEYKEGAEILIGEIVVEYGSDADGDVRVMTALRRCRQVVELCDRGLKSLKA